MSKLLLLFVICIISGNVLNGGATEGKQNVSVPNINVKSVSTEAVPVISTSEAPASGKVEASTTIENVSAKAQENAETSTSSTLSSSAATSEATSPSSTPNSVNNGMTVTSVTTASSTLASTMSSSITANTTTTSTTTPLPPSTSTLAPAPAPTPLPPAQLGNWTFGDKNHTCVVIEMAAQFNVSYMTTLNTTSFWAFNLPPSNETEVVNGSCDKMENYIVLSWNATNNTTNNLTLHFMKNMKENEYSLHHFEVALAPAYLPMYNSNKSLLLMHNASHFSVGLSNSYKCKQPPILGLANSTNHQVGNLTITQLQFQAFRTDNSTQFSAAKDCIFDTPDIVPIAVGCALAGLVVIVLIAYLVGRRRSQVRGYSSM